MKPVPLIRATFASLGMLLTFVFLLSVPFQSVRAADRDDIQAFLNVTGFDVALDSIAFSATSAPQMLGLEPDDFGSAWQRIAKDVFDTGEMRGIAMDILEHTLSDDLLTHAVDFYGSDFGQRLVAAENASHMVEDDDGKLAQGRQIVADLVAAGDARLEILKRMTRAIDAAGNSLKALQEIQFRFLMAADAAGIFELRMGADDLRNMLEAQSGPLRLALQESALAGAAYTYQGFTDGEIDRYVVALENPVMQRVYQLLNAVQYEIMANRFEVLAAKMSGMRPSQDI